MGSKLIVGVQSTVPTRRWWCGVGPVHFEGQNDYLNILPGIHLRRQLFEDTPLRISFTRTLARPNYSDLAPFVLQDTSALTISKGNPDLKVTTSNNFDVSLEHYFKNVGIVSADSFYKRLAAVAALGSCRRARLSLRLLKNSARSEVWSQSPTQEERPPMLAAVSS